MRATTPCRLWTRVHSRNGYGRIKYKGRTLHTYRLAYALGQRQDPLEMSPAKYVLHDSDNPSFIETSHLREGDQSTNIAEAWEAKRNGKRMAGA